MDTRKQSFRPFATAIPAGHQSPTDLRITRRGLLGGLAVSTAIVQSGIGFAAGSEFDWYDLEFSLIGDGIGLTISEIGVKVVKDVKDGASADESGPAELRTTVACWQIPALAFGPRAYFDMRKPQGPINKERAEDRTLLIREATFGQHPGGLAGFIFTRNQSTRRWHIAYRANLWILSSGDPDTVDSSQSVPFQEFVSEPVPPEEPQLQKKAGSPRTNPWETIEGDRVGASLERVFGGLIVNDESIKDKPEPIFDVSIDKNLTWRIEQRGGARLLAHDRRVALTDLSFGWWRMPGSSDAENQSATPPWTEQPPESELLYFAASTKSAVVIAPGPGAALGPRDGHHVDIRSASGGEKMRLDVVVGPSPNRPDTAQTVSLLSLGRRAVRVFNNDTRLLGALEAGELRLSHTRFVAVEDGSEGSRYALWGDVLPTPEAREGSPAVRIATPAGPLLVTRQNPPLDEPGKEAAATAQASAVETNDICLPYGLPTAGSGDQETLRRLLAAAQGDRNGAPGATIYALAEQLEGNNVNSLLRLRRFHADVALLASDVALPDTSYSRLAFRHSELRFAFEDGAPLSALPLGEQPRPLATSFVWVGPSEGIAPGQPRARFDLSRAELECGRDYDLMRLRFRFDDLALVFLSKPEIHPARETFDVIVGDDGAVRDRRPVLVAEFDPQHVFEEAIFRPEPPPLPDVEFTGDVEFMPDGESGKSVKVSIGSKDDILEELAKLDWPAQRANLRKAIQARKIEKEKDKNPPTTEFKVLAEAFDQAAKGRSPEDQGVYVGPFALDPDFMALARATQRLASEDAINAAVAGLFTSVERLAAAGGGLREEGRIVLPHPTPVAWLEALRNEAVFESVEPLYGVFRSFWRDQIATYVSVKQRSADPDSVAAELGLAVTPTVDPFSRPFLAEFLTSSNRFDNYVIPGKTPPPRQQAEELDALITSVRRKFVGFALGRDEVTSLMGARLSGRSRLAFRLNCEPEAGARLYEAGLAETIPSGGDRPGAGSARFMPIAFTFEALTDWSRHEPSVTRRAQKLFTAQPSGRLPPIGARASNPSDSDMLRFQRFTEGEVTGEQRMAEVRASLRSERVATAPAAALPNGGSRPTAPGGTGKPPNAGDSPQSAELADIARLHPFPGEPLDLETSIELPARLLLSTAQDAVWRTNRRLPAVLFAPGSGPAKIIDHQPSPPDEPPLEEGLAPEDPEGPASFSGRPRDLWSVRLDLSVPPGLRAVGSADLRLGALGVPTGPNLSRLPGQGAPPRGPLAPWFIGPEQMESGTLGFFGVRDALCEVRPLDPDCNVPGPTDGTPAPPPPPPGELPAEPPRNRMLRWLWQRALFRKKLGGQKLDAANDLAIFRTSLDAFDRHQLVLLTAAYGLPVIGKRTMVKDGDESEGGPLIAGSGQIEPGSGFVLLDGTNDEAIHKPVPFDVKALSLTALGGSFLHETAFKPSAGADDLFGRKIFEGFSIESLQQDIVLGRDIRTEVVYKGYLLPLGHKASFVKLTERIFLRTKSHGIKAILRQRMYLRMADPVKLYGAVGQPHLGRLWPGKIVRLLSEKTPDILDPTFYGAPDWGVETLSGRIGLNGGPGIAFWPRTDITPSGLYRFPVEIDTAQTSLPMLFIDNIAATTATSLKAAIDHYNAAAEAPIGGDLREQLDKRRTLAIGGAKIDFAPNSKAGEAQFETETLLIYAHGRLREPAQTWRGVVDLYNTTGVLEGANQPPFFPALECAGIRIGSVERMSGGAPRPVEVEYDGHYVRYGFTDDPLPRGVVRPPAESPEGNPKNIFLNLREFVPMKMGENGDRSGGMARPETYIVAISRDKGPMGGDDTTWWQTRVEQTSGPTPVVTPEGQPPRRERPPRFELTSLARYFNDRASRHASPSLKQSPAVKPVGQAATAVADKQNLLAQIQGFFSPEAKLLGTITLKDLMRFMGLDAGNIPILKEVLEFGTAASNAANDALGSAATDIRTRVLTPLNTIVARLRKEWTALDRTLVEGQGAVIDKVEDVASNAPVTLKPISLKALYPEVEQSLSNLETSLAVAIATEDAVALAFSLNDVKRDADGLIRALRILASNAVERLEQAVSQSINDQIAALTQVFDAYVSQMEAIKPWMGALLKQTEALIAEAIADAVIAGLYDGPVTVPDLPGRLNVLVERVLVVPAMPPDVATIALKLGEVPTELAKRIKAAMQGSIDELLKEFRTKGPGNPLWKLIHDTALVALQGGNLRNKLVGDNGLLQTFDIKTRAILYDPPNGLVAKLRGLADGASEESDNLVHALVAAVEAHAGAYATEVAGELLARYPVEAARLVEGLAFAEQVVRTARATGDAVRRGDVRGVLVAGGQLSEILLGIEIRDPDTLNARLTDAIQTRVAQAIDVFNADPWTAAGGPLFGDGEKLRAEIVAVAAFKAGDGAPFPPRPSPIPIIGEDPASNPLLSAITEAIVALEAAAPAIRDARDEIDTGPNSDAVKDAIDQAEDALGEAFTAEKIIAFLSGLIVLIEGEDGNAGLIGDLKQLYADIVLFIAAAADLRAVASEPGHPATAMLERATKSARAMRRLGDRMVLGLRAMADRTGLFAREHEALILVAAGAGALSGPIESLIGALDHPETKTLLDILKDELDEQEAALARDLAILCNAVFGLVGVTALGADALLGPVEDAASKLAGQAQRLGLAIGPDANETVNEAQGLADAIVAMRAHLRAHAALRVDPASTRVVALLNAPIGLISAPETTLEEFLRNPADGAEQRLEAAFAKSRALEAAVIALWVKLERRIKGAPAGIRAAALNWLFYARIAGAPVGQDTLITLLSAAYARVRTRRNELLASAGSVPLLTEVVERALIVERAELLGEGTDRLEQEAGLLAALAAIDPARLSNPDDEAAAILLAQLSVFLAGWRTGSAAPIRILAQAETIAQDILRGDILALIDVSAFRDMLEEAVSGLIPTRYSYSYDFKTYVVTPSEPDAIFQPEQGSAFGIEVRGSLSLLDGKTDFSATAYVGPFQIYLIGGLVDAVRLKFGGAVFNARAGSSAKLDVLYEDFEIGKDLDFAKELQSFLTPSEGNGPFVQPMTRGAGIEAGYGINLGTISVGAVSFFNVSLNVSAELPFDNSEALFKVSLGRRLSPFTISALPFAGSGYFSIFAAADGVRGFEASFEFGAGGAIAFGPLSAQGRIQIGVFIRILKVNNVRTTSIYGTFFAGGSACIWIFSFGCSLYVRLGSSGDGAMYGEAVFTFSFSIGLADYDYSVTAMHREEKMGSGSGSSDAAGLDFGPSRGTRFADRRGRLVQLANADPDSGDAGRTMSDAAPSIDPSRFILAEAEGTDAAPAGPVSADERSETTIAARGPNDGWANYLDYFDSSLLPEEVTP